MRPSRRTHRSPHDEPEGLMIRLLVALVSVPIFELSLIMGLWLAAGESSWRFFVIYESIPASVHWALAGVAVAVSLVFGSKGLAWLMGHLFGTHHASQQSTLATCVLWGVVVAIAFYGYKIGG